MTESNVKEISLELINIPEERSTSVIDEHIEEEIKSSIKERGILTPLILIDVDGKLILVDGLHRLLIARELGFLKVPCLVRKGTMTDVLIENMITARQHGKSDPVGEALVLKTLMEEENISIGKAAKRLHISDSWARQILKLNQVGEQIRNMVKFGDLGVIHAQYLADIEDPAKRLELAHQAIQWRYTGDQMKAAVRQIVNPDYAPDEGETIIEASGAPAIMPTLCFICREEIGPEGGFIWLCAKDKELIRDAVPIIMGEKRAPVVPPPLESFQHTPKTLYAPPARETTAVNRSVHNMGQQTPVCDHRFIFIGSNAVKCEFCGHIEIIKP